MPKKSNHKKSGMSDFPTYHSKINSHSLKIQVIYFTSFCFRKELIQSTIDAVGQRFVF